MQRRRYVYSGTFEDQFVGPYEGHKDWAHWNVSLWLHNEYELYVVARDLLEENSLDTAASRLVGTLRSYFFNCQGDTPDGATITKDNVKEALRYWNK